MLVPVNADRSMAEPITSGSAIGAGHARRDRGEHGRAWPRPHDQAGRPLVDRMTVSRARVIPPLRGPERQREDHDEQYRARRRSCDDERDESPAPCWSGELASEASTPVRNVVTLPGDHPVGPPRSAGCGRSPEPVARSRLGAGAP